MMKELPKILIVDNRLENVLALENMLSGLDVEVIRAESGDDALGSMFRYQFSLVLLAVEMPVMSGLETAALMRGHNGILETPVIFVAEDGTDQTAQREGYAVGAADYIVRPICAEILLVKVKMFLRLHSLCKALENKNEHATSLEHALKGRNLELKIYNATLEQINVERMREHSQTEHLLELNSDGSLVVDRSSTILYTNPAAATLFNREAKRLTGEAFGFPVANGTNTEITIGDNNVVEMSVAPIDWKGESVFLVTLHDIYERKQTEAKLIQLVQIDKLTGLPNRRHCLDFLTRALARARRTNRYLAVMFLKFNDLGELIEAPGGDRGDALMLSIAARIASCVRESDLAARFDNDEFVLVLDEIITPEIAAAIAQKIVVTMAAPHKINDELIVVSCSIGIATFPQCGEDPLNLLEESKTAMYNARAMGQNNFQFFALEMQQQLEQRTRLEMDLRQALRRDEFELYYQPQIDARSGEIVALEALLRWRHSRDGLIAPDQFIPLAEDTGLMVEIGDWVMRTACKQAQVWRRALDTQRSAPLTMSVNVSLAQIGNGDFRHRVDQVLQETGIDPHSLELELDERSMMADPDALAAELESIHAQGISIAMDDFGTGPSALSGLHHPSLNTIKIDPSFVSRIGVDPRSEALIKTIITMAHSLALRVVAEGVESAQQTAFLRSNECDVLQGFYFSKPVPSDRVAELLQGGRLDHPNDSDEAMAAGF